MPITSAEATAAKAAFATQIDAMIGGTAGESASGTYSPPASAIIDHNGNSWTLDTIPSPPYGFRILTNGQWSTGGIATLLSYCSGQVMCQNAQGYYFVWTGTAWIVITDGFCPKTN